MHSNTSQPTNPPQAALSQGRNILLTSDFLERQIGDAEAGRRLARLNRVRLSESNFCFGL